MCHFAVSYIVWLLLTTRLYGQVVLPDAAPGIRQQADWYPAPPPAGGPENCHAVPRRSGAKSGVQACLTAQPCPTCNGQAGRQAWQVN